MNSSSTWGKEVDNVLSMGVSLEPLGVKNWALSRQQALSALNSFVELRVPVLGGDVCELKNGGIQYNYDNWYCDKLLGETHSDYANRSIKRAREYIENYSAGKTDEIFFTLVPGL